MKIFDKKHFEVLDGIRGVAALCILVFHILEGVNLADPVSNIINHGHLSVDIFFMLSGFVIAYAYDSRFENGMGFVAFIKRRIIRLQPMVVLGALIGMVLFYMHASKLAPRVAETPFTTLLLFTLLSVFMIPVPKSVEIRGWGEMFPVNAPQWSLFFEYIAYLLYAFWARKFSKKTLAFCVVVFAGVLLFHAVDCSKGSIAGGWVLDLNEMRIGFSRLLFPFFCGMLIFRCRWKIKVKFPMFVATVLFCVAVSIPHLGSAPNYFINGIYEWFIIVFVFPIIIMVGAGADDVSVKTKNICSFLGGISYPLYMVHCAFVYVFINYVWQHNICGWNFFWCAVATFVVSILVALLSWKFYDIPIRKYLSKLFG